MLATMLVMMACKLVTGILLWFSVLTKESNSLIEATDPSPTLRRILALLDEVHAPFVIITIFLIQVGPVLLGLGLFAVLATVGFGLKKFSGAERCNCYGSIARRSEQTAYWFSVVLFSTVLLTLFLRLSFGSKLEFDAASVWIFPSGVALAAMASHLLPHTRRFAVQAHKVGAPGAPSQQASTFETTDIVGQDISGEVIRLGEVASSCPMIVFIALSTGCPLCSSLKPILYPITALFADKLRCVFLLDAQGTIDNEDNIILRGEPGFVKQFRGERFPFAVVVESRSLSVIGSIAYGDDIGSLITRALMIALSPGPRLPSKATL